MAPTGRGHFATDGEGDEEFRQPMGRLVSTTPGSFPLDKIVVRGVIELSSSEDEDGDILRSRTNADSPLYQPPKRPQPGLLGSASQDIIDLTLDSDNDISKPSVKQHVTTLRDPWLQDDGAILTLDEPKSARRPLGTPVKRSKAPSLRQVATLTYFNGLLYAASDSPVNTSGSSRTPHTTREAHTLPSTPRAGGKKATAAAEQARREAYAQKMFGDLNRKVFSDGIPDDTKLNWNVRLLTTAGRAKWHRTRDGAQTVEIELAVKILDNDARIRNTLAHEMCHLACWIIDKNPQENHGRLFKSWAAKVMRKMPEIEVTTRHSYDINYPYEWKCEQCSKIYGRFSRSIRPDECVCGACKVGKLVPLFTIRATTKNGGRTRNAASTPQDSTQALKTSDKKALEEMAAREDDNDNSDCEELEKLMKSLDAS